ncbi:sugar kinase [Tichowtungia aerotolerans]|uniref:Sugar kinase n=1 Tax=Tichowtungia aerotolerans TaxID=2697043 RepID=A0A6P1M6C2_9BACT|nr:sugar kinase [Tichowtungia aerotolerans]QHI70349.1 sugar kinase [Tichowtungia aerotolerans]
MRENKKNGRVVTFGEVMCRFCPPDHLRFEQVSPGPWDLTFGGAESSVAASVARFGGTSEFVTALPDHAIADSCLRQLTSLGVETRHVFHALNSRMGVYFVERGANQRASQVIYDRTPSAFSQVSGDEFDWAEIFEGASWFHTTGITAAVSEGAAQAACLAVRKAKEAGLTVSVDLNFRAKLWKWKVGRTAEELAQEIMPKILQFTDVVIGNEEDAQKTLGISAENIDVESANLNADGFASVAEEIMRRFPSIGAVATTLRESISATHNNWGAVLSVRNSDPVFSPMKNGDYTPYEIHSIVDRVGGGDAFAGGLIYALNFGEFGNEQAVLDFASAASCLAHSISGDFNFSTREEVERLADGIGNGRVVR